MGAIDQLLLISSAPLGAKPVADGMPFLEPYGALGAELYELLSRRNGFYAFESALHLFPIGPSEGALDLATWNAAETWRQAYADLADGCLFFAEDAFGNPFCLAGDRVCSFDGETGVRQALAHSLEEWAAVVLMDYRFLLGHPLAHDWQRADGALPPGRRLAPCQPFVLGGAFVVENLYSAEQVELMRFRGQLAMQLRDLPDGTKVRIKATP